MHHASPIKFSADDLDEFRKRAAQLVDAVAQEPGTERYDWFLSADSTRCVVRELYRDSEAVLAHVQHVGEQLGPMVELGGGLQIDAFGAPTPELREATKPFDATWYTPLGG